MDKIIRTGKMSLLVALAAALLMSACGGSGDSSSFFMPVGTDSRDEIQSRARYVAAPVSGATVAVKNVSGATVAGPVIDRVRRYLRSRRTETSDLSSDLTIDSNSGIFTDEVTCNSTDSRHYGSLYSRPVTIGAGGSVHLDPSSTIIARLIKEYGKAPADAKSAFATAFGSTPDISMALRERSRGQYAPAAQRLAALRAMAFSQLTKDLGLGPDKQFDLIAALAGDLADDGKLNG